jgi:hypothetical protein
MTETTENQSESVGRWAISEPISKLVDLLYVQMVGLTMKSKLSTGVYNGRARRTALYT